MTGIASVKLPGSTLCFIKRIASYFIHCILWQITRYGFFWSLCCLFFFDYRLWLPFDILKLFLIIKYFVLYSLYSMCNKSFIKCHTSWSFCVSIIWSCWYIVFCFKLVALLTKIHTKCKYVFYTILLFFPSLFRHRTCNLEY